MKIHFVTHGFDICYWKRFIVDFDFLKPNNVRLVFVDERLELMQSCTESIDVKADYFHILLNLLLSLVMPFG
jgi:hypothetical protein